MRVQIPYVAPISRNALRVGWEPPLINDAKNTGRLLTESMVMRTTCEKVRYFKVTNGKTVRVNVTVYTVCEKNTNPCSGERVAQTRGFHG